MKISIKHYGASRNNPSKIIEMTVESNDTEICIDITNVRGEVDECLIQDMRDIADELETQNKLLQQPKT